MTIFWQYRHFWQVRFFLSQPYWDIASIALAVLAFGFSFDESDFFEALEGIQPGLDDFEQGQFSSLEEFIAEQNRKYGLSLEA
jgi:hypothetical protein